MLFEGILIILLYHFIIHYIIYITYITLYIFLLFVCALTTRDKKGSSLLLFVFYSYYYRRALTSPAKRLSPEFYQYFISILLIHFRRALILPAKMLCQLATRSKNVTNINILFAVYQYFISFLLVIFFSILFVFY